MPTASSQEPFADRLRRLAAEQGKSVERVASEAWDPAVKGTSANQLKQVLAGRRALKPVMIAAIAGALGVPPDEFPEYRLAMARAQLDEAEVGLDQAVANLTRYEAALRRPRAGGRHVPGQTGEGPQPVRADRPARGQKGGGGR